MVMSSSLSIGLGLAVLALGAVSLCHSPYIALAILALGTLLVRRGVRLRGAH
jgi:hypothetical protein